MLKLMDKVVFFLSLPAILGLIGAYGASFIPPHVFAFPSLLSLAYPYLLILNLLFFLYWLFRWKKTVWLQLAVLLAGIPAFRSYYGTADTQAVEEKPDISLLSYNVRYFDMYGWSNKTNTGEKLFAYLNKFPGDLICLQEFMLASAAEKQKEIIGRLKSYPYHHVYKGMAIFSRLPLVHKGHLEFDDKYTSTCIYCDVVRGKDTVRLYSVHLESYRFGKKERRFVKEVSSAMGRDELSEGVKNLTSRLTVANRNRAFQAEEIKRHLESSPYPVILCGDFNDTPLSYTYRRIKNGLQDAFIEKGRGLGNTYIGEFPSFRIDYIFHSPEMEAQRYTRENIFLSDHYPIQADLRLK